MEIMRIALLALCSVLLIIIVKNYKPEFGVPTALACGLLILYFLVDSLRYAFVYMSQLYTQLSFGKAYFPIIIKVLAIAYITEFSAQLCRDAGESSIAAKVELAGKILIFCVAIPVFASILQLVEQLLG